MINNIYNIRICIKFVAICLNNLIKENALNQFQRWGRRTCTTLSDATDSGFECELILFDDCCDECHIDEFGVVIYY